MISLQLVILVVAISMIGLWFYFFIRNKIIKQAHSKRLQILTENVEMHQSQIHIRDKGLDTYKFLRYNLAEALVIQPEIKL